MSDKQKKAEVLAKMRDGGLKVRAAAPSGPRAEESSRSKEDQNE